MKKRVIQFIILFIVASNIYSQRYTITIDSLRTHFRNEKPYDVYDYYKKRESWFSKENYKLLYYDQEMKEYLLRWLDQDQIIDYKANVFRKYLEGFNEDNKISMIKSYIKREFNLNPDSIKADDPLWKLYADSVINSYVKEEKVIILERKEKEKKDILPDMDVIYFHSQVAYPEAYKIIKGWWYQYDKPVADNDAYFNSLFTCLLSMNDPEAQFEFDKAIKKYVQSDGKENYGISLTNCLDEVNNAYGIIKMLQLLPIQIDMPGLEDGREITTYVPFDYFTFRQIQTVLMAHDIKVAGLFDNIKTMRKNKEEIIRLANQLIEKLEADEQHWMVNMPFDYVPDVSKIKE
jgi:hypothetical protein